MHPRPPISASPKVQRPRRRRDPSVGPSSTRGLEEHDGSGCSSCSTGAEIAAAPSRVACSRSLLGQSVTRQVGAAGRSIAPSSQVLPVIPMPGRTDGRHPIFAPTAVFWRLQPGLDLQQESEQGGDSKWNGELVSGIAAPLPRQPQW